MYCDEIGKFLVVVEKGIEVGGIVRRQRKILRPDCARRSTCQSKVSVSERSSKIAIATELPNTSWIQRSDIGSGAISSCVEHAQIMPVARTQHDPVLAERHGTGVAIFGLVMNCQQRHRQAIMMILGWTNL